MPKKSRRFNFYYFAPLSLLSVATAIYLGLHLRKTSAVLAFALAIIASISATGGVFRAWRGYLPN